MSSANKKEMRKQCGEVTKELHKASGELEKLRTSLKYYSDLVFYGESNLPALKTQIANIEKNLPEWRAEVEDRKKNIKTLTERRAKCSEKLKLLCEQSKLLRELDRVQRSIDDRT